MTGFEPVTSSLPRKRSTPELHRLKKRARDRVRTGDIQLGRLTLYQLSYSRINFYNPCKFNVGRAGFEPAKVKPTDLQSVLVGRLSISPIKIHSFKELNEHFYSSFFFSTNNLKTNVRLRADGGTRTHDLLITNQLL